MERREGRWKWKQGFSLSVLSQMHAVSGEIVGMEGTWIPVRVKVRRALDGPESR